MRSAHPAAAAIVRTSLIYGGAAPSRPRADGLDVADGRADLAFFTDELRCPVRVADLAEALLALAELDHRRAAPPRRRRRVSPLRVRLPGRRGERPRSGARPRRPVAELAPPRPLDCRLDASLCPLASRDAASRRARGAQGASRSIAHAAVGAAIAEAVVQAVRRRAARTRRRAARAASRPSGPGGARRAVGIPLAQRSTASSSSARDATGRLCGEAPAPSRLSGGRPSK